RVSKNVFKVNKQNEEFTFSLDVSVEQIPPYPINFDLISTSLVKFGIEVLGGSTGFSATNASSGLALCYNSNYMLIDAIPYLNHHLKARGIARNQVYSLFLSHVHDDHCNILSLLQYNRRITILTTNIIFQMTLKKLSLIMDKPESELKDYFIFIPLEVNKATNYYGMKITPFYSVHSIPTIGGIFEVIHQGKSYRILFTGDTQSLKDIKSMIEKNVISEERYNSLKNIYTERWDLLLADGGEGLIHGDPSDAEDSESDRIVFLHLDKLPDKFETQFSIASSGKRFTILPGQTDYWLTRTIEFLLEYFPKMPPGWISNLLGDRDIRRYNAGDIIIRQGSKSQGEVFIILTGYAQVISHDGKTRQVLAQIEAGELIGEMASIIGKGQRSASVVALSPVVVSTFSEEAFRDFIYSLGYEKRLEQLWLTRNYLQKFEALRFISQPVLRSIAERVHFHTLESVNTPATFSKHFKKGSLLFPVEEGLFLHSNTYKTEAKPNRDIIYISPELQYSTKKKAEVMVLDSLMAKKLRKKIPLFRFFWEEELRFPSA
ncbi:MAG: cyclic nucleotide-binding domain-containing protein, partial [Leptospiraceae bacterium]|nr:cyclic nucleotide-binding domain-containing protein [Leptospiraceae bacterium]